MNDVIRVPSVPPLKSVGPVTVDRLVLDRQNPRLVSIESNATDLEIIAQLYRAENLDELLESIAANGYLDIEPLIVLEEGESLVVLEGNRRLAAIRLFKEPDLTTRLFEQSRVKISVPVVSKQHLSTLDSVSVYRVESREDARSFIGFKHINGAAKWESYAKAKFAADWYRSGDVSLIDIASRIGDKHDTIKRMVNAIYALEQAETKDIFRIADRARPRFSFSHLYTALSRAQYMRHLGLVAAWSRHDPNPNPVPDDHLNRLGEVLRWLYGSREEDIDPVVQSQNPDIKHLGDVLESQEGLTVLRAKGSLAEAHMSMQPAGQRLSEALLRARREVREASNSLRGFDGRDTALINIAEDVSETAQTVHARMKKKMQIASMEDG